MASRTVAISEKGYWLLRSLALEAKMGLKAYLDLLLTSEQVRQRHPRDLIDTPVPYHTHTEPIFGPGSGYTPWTSGTAADKEQGDDTGS